MSERHKKYYDNLDKLTQEKQVSTRVANDVLYLRTQPQWSQSLEDDFIEKSRTGVVPDVTKVGVP